MNIKEKIKHAIADLNLSGKNVCIHSSMRTYGSKSHDLPQIIKEAFLENSCTILVPTFSYMLEAKPVPHLMPKQNAAGDYSDLLSKNDDDVEIFSVDCKHISTKDMGVFAEHVLFDSNSVRGNHPTNSFTAIGENSVKFTENQRWDDVYAPLKYLCDTDGYLILMGVDLDCATIIHYAEEVAGRNLFIRWAKDSSGETVSANAGSCSDGFNNFEDALSIIERKITVDGCVWRCFKASDLVEICAAEMKKNPMISHCGDKTCERCNDIVAGGPYYD